MTKCTLIAIETCHSWIETIHDEDDFCVILRETRGSYKRSDFYDVYPQLKIEAQAFAMEKAKQKKSSFNVRELADFINNRFIELYGPHSDDICELIRSESSCRIDLLKWGAKYEKNSNRPYFEGKYLNFKNSKSLFSNLISCLSFSGHEREDVVSARVELLDHFLPNKHFYYHTERNASGISYFVVPESTDEKRILLAHDESTYRSGEIAHSRWLFPNNTPFYNKGRGRSIMVSDFLAMHPICQIFRLDEDEWKDACR
jgi:hypothetical protein